MTRFSGVAVSALTGLLFFSPVWAQAQSQPDAGCSLQTPVFVTGAPNIFNDEQEQYLGDALAEHEENDLRLVPTAADDQLTKIGERLLAVLPPTSMHYRFRIYDSGEINGFSLAGGRVYISRKLIAAVKNEDELAGVLAHEIGHISTHQVAVDFTRILRVRLGVTQVTDRADIFSKIHRLLSTPEKPGEEKDTETKDQLAADHVAMYAMVRAGYAPDSFALFLNESLSNKGKTGNWLSDAFGVTHESSQRYRAALKAISVLPQGCKGKQPGTSVAFAAWQKSLTEERVKTVAEGATGDRPLTLDTPLRASPWRIRFSQDGRYVLMQDENSIVVADRSEQKALFRIDAQGADAAWFTPDSKSIVFSDPKLRVERWSLASGKRENVKELVLFDGCDQSLLSPDGRTLVCATITIHADSPRLDLKMIDVESGNTVLEKQSFVPTGYFADMVRLRMVLNGTLEQAASMIVSQDGRYLVIAFGQHILAYDFQERNPITLGGKIKALGEKRMSFFGANTLAEVGDSKGKGLWHLLLLSFPDGQTIKDWSIGDQHLWSVSKGNYLLAGPLKDYPIGVLDPEQEKFVAATRIGTMDVWDKWIATESGNGGLRLVQLGGRDAMSIPLSLGLLPLPRAVAFSADGKYLAVSLNSRAEVWNLENGKPVAITRPFRSAWFDEANVLWAEMPKYADQEATTLHMKFDPRETKDLGKFEAEDWQYGDLQLRFRPMGKEKDTSRHATLEVKKLQTQTVLWTRDYQHEMPACWSASGGRLVLAWDLSTEGADAEMKAYPALRNEAQGLHNHKKGMLLETVEAATGKPLEQIVLPEIDLTQGWNDKRKASVSGEAVLVHGEHDNTVIYRMKDGSKVGEFFGTVVATDATTGVVVAIHQEDELLVVDANTGKELRRFTLGSPVRVAAIVGEKEKMLVVLTADQVVHRLPLAQ